MKTTRPRNIQGYYLLLTCLLLVALLVNMAISADRALAETPATDHGSNETGDSKDDWFDDPAFDIENISTDHVSEGELRFLAPITDKRVLTTEASLKITEDSMLTGLVDMEQCYSQLDPVPAVDILYSFDEIHALSITSTNRIGKARVNGHALQLEDVKDDGSVCVKSKIRILEEVSADNFRIRYGPYYRRFLDGFYPYHVILKVDYPSSVLRFKSVSPSPENSFELNHAANSLKIDAWFEGILTIDMHLVSD